jgi:hypothetical protein
VCKAWLFYINTPLLVSCFPVPPASLLCLFLFYRGSLLPEDTRTNRVKKAKPHELVHNVLRGS